MSVFVSNSPSSLLPDESVVVIWHREGNWCLPLLNWPIVPVYLAGTFVSAKAPIKLSGGAAENVVLSQIKKLLKGCCYFLVAVVVLLSLHADR